MTVGVSVAPSCIKDVTSELGVTQGNEKSSFLNIAKEFIYHDSMLWMSTLMCMLWISTLMCIFQDHFNKKERLITTFNSLANAHTACRHPRTMEFIRFQRHFSMNYFY